MSGQNLTAEEKAAAEKAAEAEKKKATKNHVAVTKDGETIRVHPSQVEQHKRLGWSIKPK